jgi:transcriptional regulator with XRE-family HTH domain
VKEDTAMELGKKIVEQRKKAQLTQEELASQLYVYPSDIEPLGERCQSAGC